MKTPLVSVILPVYNTEKYIAASISSILKQSFSDFELIVIDDCSTDSTISIIETFSDDRIKLIRKPENSGYVKSLNSAIRISTGAFIARMDADDVSLPTRLEKQVHYLYSHPDVSVVATRIEIIDEQGIKTGLWKNDQLCTSRTEINRALPFYNCICHPSVMMRRELFTRFEYDNNQYGSEDWDLWLNLVSSGLKIEKIEETLLQYRQLNGSVSDSIDSAIGVRLKGILVRIRYLKKKFRTGHVTLFDLRVLNGIALTLFNLMKHKLRKMI